VFSWSYTALSTGRGPLFGCSAAPGPDISPSAAASLVGLSRRRPAGLLIELARASTGRRAFPARYTFHDLLRAYAADLTGTHDPSATARRPPPAHRLYLHTGHAAARLLHPPRSGSPAYSPPPRPASRRGPAGSRSAMAWLTSSIPSCSPLCSSPVTPGSTAHTWQLAWRPSNVSGPSRPLARPPPAPVWSAALLAAQRLDDPIARPTRTAGSLGAYPAGHYQNATTICSRALELCAEAGDHRRPGAHPRPFRLPLGGTGRGPDQALDHAERMLALFRTAGHHRGEPSPGRRRLVPRNCSASTRRR